MLDDLFDALSDLLPSRKRGGPLKRFKKGFKKRAKRRFGR